MTVLPEGVETTVLPEGVEVVASVVGAGVTLRVYSQHPAHPLLIELHQDVPLMFLSKALEDISSDDE